MSDKKVAVVTGSNKGIGFELVRHLCKEYPGDVILCSRDEARGQDAVKKLKDEGLNPILQVVDITNLDTINRLKEFLLKNYGGLDLLVNNAAIYFLEKSFEDTENILNTNYFCTAQVCDVLFPILRSGARVLNVTSNAGCLNWISGKDIKDKLLSPTLTRKEIDDLGNLYLSHVKEGVADSKGWPKLPMGNAYFVSKILLNALTFVQHRQFEENDPEKDIVVNSVHPGYVQTDITQNNGIYTTKDSIPALSLGCFVPPKGHPRGQFIFDDATIADWNQPYEDLKDTMLNRYKIPLPL